MMLRKIRFFPILFLLVLLSLSVAYTGVSAQGPQLEPCVLPVDQVNGQGGLTVGALGLTPGALGLTPGALGLTPGALGLTPGALALTPGALALTPGALGLTPGALDNNSDTALLQLFNEIVNNLVDYQLFDDQLQPIKAGYQFGTKPVAFVIADDFEDVETDLLTHGELVKFIAQSLLKAAGLDSIVTIYPVDITDGINNFVVNDPNPNDGVPEGIAARIAAKVAELRAGGYTRFILNMSFGLIPCDDVINVNSTSVTVSMQEFANFQQQSQVTQPITGILECVAYNADGTYTAHFGYINPNDYPVVLPYGPTNKLTGGGLTADELMARTPFYFGVPADNPARPKGSNFYPNSAFQVVFRSVKTPLVWTYPGGTVTVGYKSPKCPPAVTPDKAYADEVVAGSFIQGLRSDGKPVLAERSDPTKALGAPQGNDTQNYVSLGFGGEVVLKFNTRRFVNPFGPDLQIIETSFGNPSYTNYPERADVSVSQDGVNFIPVGTALLDASFELPAGTNWFQYVKIKDTTDLTAWKKGKYGTGDGYDIDGIKTCGAACVPDVQPIFECAVFDSTLGRYIAHFGYNNLKGSPVVIPHGPGLNEISGGGLTAAEKSERTPELFGYPQVVSELPGRTQYYANSGLQIAFDGSALTWTLLGPDGSLRTATAIASPEHECLPVPKINDVSFADYLRSKGITQVETVLQQLTSNPALDDPNLNDLVGILQGYLDESAGSSDFAFIPLAAAGNSAPTLGPAPLAPARFSQTIAIGALLGQNPGTFAAGWSQNGNIATPGAWYEFFDMELYGAGTSYATPFAGAYASAFLTFADPDACDFRDTTLAHVGGVPLVGDDTQVFNNLPISSKLDCVIPVPPPPMPTCNGLPATIWVEAGIIRGGPGSGMAYAGTLTGTNGDDVIVGTTGKDIIFGLNGIDVICGLDGGDYIEGGNANDTLFAGAGNTGGALRTSGLVAMHSGGSSSQGATIKGGNGDDTIYGGDYDDTLRGDNGNDVIYGGAGNDYIDGGSGDDILDGQAGDYDQIYGGDSNDQIYDGDGFLGAHGGKGNDTIVVTIRSGWRYNGQAKLDGRLTGGYNNDTVSLTLADPTPFYINISGDEWDTKKAPSEGSSDVLNLYGTPPKSGSVIIKFETVNYPSP